MRTTTGNKRLDEAIRKELKVNRGGQIWLDCFMGRTSHTEIAPTITTRISSDNNNFIMERNMNEDKKTKVAMTLDEGKWAKMHEQSRREYDIDGIAPTQHCNGGGNLEPKTQEPINTMPNFRIRKLTPRECFRLMDVDDKDIDTIQAAGISDSQQYKLAGNSIVVNVLTEIFRKLFVDTQPDDGQMKMF